MVTTRSRTTWGARILAGMLLAATTVLSGCFYHHGHHGQHGGPRGGWYGFDDGHWDHDSDRDRDGRRDRDHDRDRRRDRDRRYR